MRYCFSVNADINGVIFLADVIAKPLGWGIGYRTIVKITQVFPNFSNFSTFFNEIFSPGF